ncbi:unnamed protein product [Prunus armeniaca]
MKWAIELSLYDLLYQPKTAIKAQALADFVAEFTSLAKEEKLVSKKKESLRVYQTSTELDQPRNIWQLRVDGASNQKGAGAGVIIITPNETLLKQAITLGFPASNNEAEYEALLADIRSQATSLISIADKLLNEAQTQLESFSSIMSLTYAHMRQASSPL